MLLFGRIIKDFQVMVVLTVAMLMMSVNFLTDLMMGLGIVDILYNFVEIFTEVITLIFNR